MLLKYKRNDATSRSNLESKKLKNVTNYTAKAATKSLWQIK